MCGINQKIDLGELLSERRMKSQIRGKRILVALLRQCFCVGNIYLSKQKGDNTCERISRVRSDKLEERITPGVSEGGHPAQTADSEHAANPVARIVRNAHHG